MRYSQLSAFGKVSRVLQWILIPFGFALAGNHGGWLGASIGCGCALMILRLMRDLEHQATSNEHLRNVALRAVDGYQPTIESGGDLPPGFCPNPGGSGTQPPPPRKLDITIKHGEPK